MEKVKKLCNFNKKIKKRGKNWVGVMYGIVYVYNIIYRGKMNEYNHLAI